MPFDTAVEMPSEVVMYNERWQRLLDHVHAGIPLHEQVREAIEAWGKRAKPESKTETDPDKRLEQVQAKVAAMSSHFAPVIGTVSVWFEGLKPLMSACQASLDGLPLQATVDGVHMAFSRASNVRIPDKPHLDLNDADTLDRRSRWLREVQEIMVRAESGPREIGASLRALEDVLARFNQELDSAKGLERKGNVSCLRWLVPTHPQVGSPPPSPKPAQPKDDLAFMYR
jgi:hypothetical protein